MPKYNKNEDILSSMSNLQPKWCSKIDFQKVDQHAGGKWLIHDTKRHKDNHLQSLKWWIGVDFENDLYSHLDSNPLFQSQFCICCKFRTIVTPAKY